MDSILDTVRKSLENSGYLSDILKEHDVWFNSKEDFPEERAAVKENGRNSIIDWIMGTDPVMEEGGLLTFIQAMKDKNFLK